MTDTPSSLHTRTRRWLTATVALAAVAVLAGVLGWSLRDPGAATADTPAQVVVTTAALTAGQPLDGTVLAVAPADSGTDGGIPAGDLPTLLRSHLIATAPLRAGQPLTAATVVAAPTGVTVPVALATNRVPAAVRIGDRVTAAGAELAGDVVAIRPHGDTITLDIAAEDTGIAQRWAHLPADTTVIGAGR